MIVYKIVFLKWQKEMVSIVMQMGGRKPGVKYNIGETTIPLSGCGPLGAFDTIDNANEFVRQICFSKESVVCLLCDAEGSTEEFFYFGEGDDFISKKVLPTGTVLCKSITPIRKVNI